ncbi:Transcriptional regulatory protein, C terminal [Lutimaribacter saemankumensis]|uniref:Transcriptional regulatory protein, C terminal n=2 Tax=Lutimaribacter saemankumensis TaxID=490829 RepID=A0A1G8TFY3_9RHOB|nr:Transcriptional regulatory protein, C terminal [Lutimaribacter saemankumensis]
MRYFFANCELNTASRTFLRDGETIPLEPQVFDLLHLLAERAGQVVSKDELIDAVWNGRIVSDATISARINAARTAVGDNGKDQRVIRTVSRRGFEMVSDVSGETKSKASLTSERGQAVRYTPSKDGTNIAWSSVGEGPPILYAWHHISHLEKDWRSKLLRPIFDALSENHRLVRYDIRGSGLSDPINPKDTLDNHVDDMLAVADAAGLDRFPVVSVLQSAATAIRFCSLHPERVSSLVIQNGYARGRATREGASDTAESDPFITLLKSGGWGDPDNGFMRAWATMVLPMASFEETTDLIHLISHAGSGENALLQRQLIDRLNVLEDLERVQTPTLVIHSRMCPIHPATEGRKVAAGIPGAEFLEVDSSNTFLVASDPAFQEIMAHTLEFLGRTDGQKILQS